MRMRASVFLAALSWIALVTACGGTVVEVTAADGAGTAPPTCTAFCDALNAAGCLSTSTVSPTIEEAHDRCVVFCVTSRANAGVCAPEADANLACAEAEIPTACDWRKACAATLEAVQSCIIPETCDGPEECDFFGVKGPPGCTRTCAGTTYASNCSEASCSCEKGGQVLGTCAIPESQVGTGTGQDLYVGCCAQSFAASH